MNTSANTTEFVKWWSINQPNGNHVAFIVISDEVPNSLIATVAAGGLVGKKFNGLWERGEMNLN